MTSYLRYLYRSSSYETRPPTYLPSHPHATHDPNASADVVSTWLCREKHGQFERENCEKEKKENKGTGMHVRGKRTGETVRISCAWSIYLTSRRYSTCTWGVCQVTSSHPHDDISSSHSNIHMMTSRHITGTMYLLLELLQDGKYKGIKKVAEVSFFFRQSWKLYGYKI